MAALATALVGCDPGGRLAQLTPQPTVATPTLPDVTVEAPGGPIATEVAAPGGAIPVGPTPQPTATYDPTRPAWTILYYAGTDNGRAAYVWNDLNEMESAAATDEVRTVAQVDWAAAGPAGTVEMARYLIRPGEDGALLTSEVVGTQSEINMGDPAALADFLTWGIANYPANRYALFLGDFGGGWRGCCFDEAVGVAGQVDHLTLDDLERALALAQGQTGARFEIIAFAAGLMNQIDVLQTIQPYAAYAVASPGLVPGSSWDYRAVLTELNADPLVDGRQFSGDLVTAFVNTQRQLEEDEFVAMAAVDLANAPIVTAAVETLAQALGTNPELYGAIAADARRGAQLYGAAALAESEHIAAVDLLHAAAIIAEIAPPGELQSAAAGVVAAVNNALVAYDHGAGIPYGRGIAIYWPTALDPAYAATSRLPAWTAYLAASAPAAFPARATVDRGLRETVNIANPALMRAEIVAHRLVEAALVADQEAADGRRVLRQYETIQPAAVTFPGGANANLWADGRRESLIVWDATAAFLTDATGTGDFVPLRPVDQSPAGPQLAAAGQFRRAGGDRGVDATAIFTPGSPASRHVWATAVVPDGARLIGEIPPSAGDVFQPSVIFVDAAGHLTAEPGVALVFDAVPAIYRSTRPLPAGNYAVGMRLSPLGAPPVMATQPLVVDPADATEGFRAYVDAARNVQFLYPAGWRPPATREAITYTSNISETAQMQVRYYPGWAGDLAALQNEAMGTFSGVSILLNESTRVGADAVEAMRTAYGYESAETGARTGVFLTFLKDGVGYVVDMDAPRAEEATTLAAINTIAATWQFLPERLGFGPELWGILNVGEFRVAYPSAFAYQEFNGWHRFAADAQTFAAVRIQPGERAAAEAMAGLLQTAAQGVTGFTADAPQQLFYGGHLWERNDFSCTDANGAIVSGLLLSRQDGDSEVAFWAEAPDPPGELFESLFLPIAASIERIPPPPSG
jgi:hypothetical protein